MNRGGPTTPTEVPPPAPAFTARAVLWGSLWGAALGGANLYLGLRTGLGMAVAVTAGAGGYVLQRALGGGRLGLGELCVVQTVASSAGYATGAALASAHVAHLLLVGTHPPPWMLWVWTVLLSLLGVCFGLPMRRALLERELLPFPSATAAALTARALSERRTGLDTPALTVSGVCAAAWGWLRDAVAWVPASWPLPGTLGGASLKELTWAVDFSPLSLGVGVLVGPRTAASALCGALLCHAVLAPRWGPPLEPGGGLALGWGQWAGAAILVAAGFAQLTVGASSVMRAVRAPGRSSLALSVVSAGVAIAVVVCARAFFGVPWLVAAAAVAVCRPLCRVAARATGETDVTPCGPLGQLSAWGFSRWSAGGPTGPPAVLGMVTNATMAASDFLANLKMGRMLGIPVRTQVCAQVWGAGVGALALVPAFYALVPDLAALGLNGLAAPAGRAFAGLTQLWVHGASALAPVERGALAGGASAGVALGLLEALAPERLRRRVPSPTGLGLAFLLPASFSLSLAMGAAVAYAARRGRRSLSEQTVGACASGAVAGEGLAGLAVAIAQNV